MDYEKKYNESLELARDYYKANLKLDKADENLILEDIFPELKESDDENIRQEIITFIKKRDKSGCDYDYNLWLAWLKKQGKKEPKETFIWKHWKDGIAGNGDGEPIYLIKNGYTYSLSSCLGCECDYILLSDLDKLRQGELKPISFDDSVMIDSYLNDYCCKIYNALHKENCGILSYARLQHLAKDIFKWCKENQDEQKSTDKPKFKIGDWIIQENIGVYKVIEVCESWYEVVDNKDKHYSIGFDKEYMCRLWIIQDARDGDVLVCESGWTCIFKTLVNDETFSSYCFMDKTKWFCETGSEGHTLKEEFIKAYNGKIYPATKEQRDSLMKAMADAGWEFDFEKKELKKIEQKPIDECDEYSKMASDVIVSDNDKPKFKVKYANSEYNVLEIKEIAGVTFYGIEDEPNHIDYVKADNCEIINGGYGIKENGFSVPTKPIMFSEQKPAWSVDDEKRLQSCINILKAKSLMGKVDTANTMWLKSLKERIGE